MNSRSRRPWRELAGGLAIAGVATVLLSSIPGVAAAGSGEPQFTPAAEVREAWNELTSTELTRSAQYALPAGVSLPDAPPSILESRGGFVREGVLNVVAVYFYVCAWEDSLAGALEGDSPSNVQLAQNRLTEVAELPGAKEHFQDIGRWTSEINERLDDVDALKADVSNCTYYLEDGNK